MVFLDMSGTGKGKGKGKSAPPSGGAGAEGGKGKKSKSVSRSSRAGLQFPVGRIHRHLKSKVRFCNSRMNFAINNLFRFLPMAVSVPLQLFMQQPFLNILLPKFSN